MRKVIHNPQICYNPNAKNIYLYACDVLDGRWEEYESIVMKDPHYAVNYAIDILKKRWPDAEPYILKCPVSSYFYAQTVIKGRWPEAELNIMKYSPSLAFSYAYFVINGRWEEAESYIKRDKQRWNWYVDKLQRKNIVIS